MEVEAKAGVGVVTAMEDRATATDGTARGTVWNQRLEQRRDLCLLRESRSAAYTEREMRSMRRIAPHLARGLKVAATLDLAKDEAVLLTNGAEIRCAEARQGGGGAAGLGESRAREREGRGAPHHADGIPRAFGTRFPCPLSFHIDTTYTAGGTLRPGPTPPAGAPYPLKRAGTGTPQKNPQISGGLCLGGAGLAGRCSAARLKGSCRAGAGCAPAGRRDPG